MQALQDHETVISVIHAVVALGDFVTFWLIRGCALGPLEASALGGKTSSAEGKVW